jgi:hypothetical protein
MNQTLDAELASEMARFFGADTNVITFEEQASKDIDDAAGAGEEESRRRSIRASARGDHYGPRRSR